MSIASEITRLQNAKASIKTSIENKGVTVGNGTLDTYASKIDAIETGITPTGTINITENGTYDVTDKASANVNVEGLKGTKIEITKNGTYTPEEPYNAFTEVEANVEADVSEYFGNTLQIGGTSGSALNQIIKKVPPLSISRPMSNYLFYNCTSLETIPLIDMSISVNVQNDFYNCSALTNFGGFKNLGQLYSTTQSANYYEYKLDLSSCTKLTHDSLMNVINNLYDIATKGVKTQQVVIGSKNLAKLTAEEIAIATSKGWSIS